MVLGLNSTVAVLQNASVWDAPCKSTLGEFGHASLELYGVDDNTKVQQCPELLTSNVTTHRLIFKAMLNLSCSLRFLYYIYLAMRSDPLTDKS